jgi:hypothetical protein
MPHHKQSIFSARGRIISTSAEREISSNAYASNSIPASQHNQAVFAFRLAREATGKLIAAYTTEGSRIALTGDEEFARAFLGAKQRVRAMQVRYVEETDPLRQALLEIYASIVLQTRYNDFNTH